MREYRIAAIPADGIGKEVIAAGLEVLRVVETRDGQHLDQPDSRARESQRHDDDQRPARPSLSEQEQQALLLWFQGMSKASVGRRMSISENTVRQYINRARAKYAATGRAAPSKDALLARANQPIVGRAKGQERPGDGALVAVVVGVIGGHLDLHRGSKLFGEPGIDLQAGERVAPERPAPVDEALIRVRLVGTCIAQRAEC